MRYSSALVLSTIVVGQAAAGNLHNRHASFHARRQAAEAKRSIDNVDWDQVAYDLGGVNWSSVFASPTPAAAADPPAVAAAVATPAPAKEPAKAVEVTKQDVTTSSAAAYSAAKPSPSPSPSSSSVGDSIGDILGDVGDAIGEAVSDIMTGVQEVADKLKCKIGKNDKSNNGNIWIGDDSQWTAEFINNKNEDAVLYCWASNGYDGMIITKFQPAISVGIPSGKSITLSWAADVPSACSPIYPSTNTAMFGGVDNTWWEVTFGKYGAFDVSRNVNMNGDSISSKGSKCVSDMDTCVFKCKNGLDTCEQGADYDLYNCNASGGGGGGYDVKVAGTGGGCSMGENSEHVKVVLG